MKNYVTKILLGLSFVSLLISCGGVEIEISADSNGGVLILDGVDTLIIDGDSTFVYEIDAGEHNMVYNSDEVQTFKVGRNGGMLNLGRQRFVRMTGIYAVEQEDYGFGNSNIGIQSDFMQNMITIDSNIYIMADNANEIKDADVERYIKKFYALGGRNPNSRMMKLIEDELFISKDWDYGINEEFPDDIVMSESSGNTIKTKIIEENIFLLFAMLSPENIRTVSLSEREAAKKEAASLKSNQADSNQHSSL